MISRMAASPAQNPIIATGARRYALLACGCCNVALGLIGAVVPGMPTTIFLIIALWAFSRSSPRLRRWLYDHSRYGQALREWDRHGIITLRAKRLAAATMLVSLEILAMLASSWIVPLSAGAVMAAVMAFIATRPSTHPV